MKKLSLSLILLAVSALMFAVDWSSIAWLADGAGQGAYANKYKVAAAFGQNVVNIQKPTFATAPGIYTNFPAGIGSCTLAEGSYALDGAGMILYLSAFTAKVTDVTVVAGGVNYDFQVFYADGEGDIPDDQDTTVTPQPGDLTPATYYGSSTVSVSGADCVFDWSITRNADATLTFEIAWSADIVGAVPQICLEGIFITMPAQAKMARLTTTATYTDGATLSNTFFYIAYSGGVANIPITGYTVGASNEEPQPSSIENTFVGQKARKIIENGQVIIIKNGLRYNLLGTEIK